MNNLNSKVYKFLRIKYWKKLSYGPYVYRHTQTGELIASWQKPLEDQKALYTGEYIGYNTDAVIITELE